MDLPVGVEIRALEVRQHSLPTVQQVNVPSLRGFILPVQRGEMMAKGVDSDRQRRNCFFCFFLTTEIKEAKTRTTETGAAEGGQGTALYF